MMLPGDGKCGRRNKTLTVPESVESGFGPECIKAIDGGALKTLRRGCTPC